MQTGGETPLGEAEAVQLPSEGTSALPLPILSYATPGQKTKRRPPRDGIYDVYSVGVAASCWAALANLDDHQSSWIIALSFAQVIVFCAIAVFRGPRPVLLRDRWITIFFCGLIANAICVWSANAIFSAFPWLLARGSCAMVLVDLLVLAGPMLILTAAAAIALVPNMRAKTPGNSMADQ